MVDCSANDVNRNDNCSCEGRKRYRMAVCRNGVYIYEETTHGNFTHCPGRSRYFGDWKIGNARKGKGAERGLISVFQS